MFPQEKHRIFKTLCMFSRAVKSHGT